MLGSIIVAVITGLFALAGTYLANRKSAALVEYRLGELEKKVDKQNGVEERTYALEQAKEVQDEKIKTINHRIDGLERRLV
ncbi:MAG: hypothetical protein IJL43_00580 [Lachnospiraceae bacterium]|nr:hypothetical protein [Lachnospiraceae bacterium]